LVFGALFFLFGQAKRKETSVNSIKQVNCPKKLPKTLISAQNSQKIAKYIK
jgi:hypothetical protein